MRLSDRDKRILYHAQFHQEENLEALREQSKAKLHSIRYCLSQSKERGLIEQRRFIDFCKLGYTPFALYFSLSGQSGADVQKILHTLCSSPAVSWVGELGGDYQFGVCVNVKSSLEVLDFIDSITDAHGEVFATKALATRLELKFFGNKYLLPNASHTWELGYHIAREHEALDELDHRILQQYGNSSPKSQRAVAQELGVAPSTIDFRVKKLREREILGGTYLQINSQMLGMQSFLLLVAVKGNTPAMRQAFFSFCKSHPNIVILIHALGPWDFELAVDVSSARDIVAITQQVREHLGAAVDFVKTLPLFRYAKVSEYPFS